MKKNIMHILNPSEYVRNKTLSDIFQVYNNKHVMLVFVFVASLWNKFLI